MTKTIATLLTGAGLCILSACAPAQGGNPSNLASNVGDTIGCSTFKDTLFDDIYAFPLENQKFPTEEQLRASLNEKLTNGRFANVSSSDRQGLIDRMVNYYTLLTVEAPRSLAVNADESQNVIHTLAALELGDRTSEEKIAIQDKLAVAYDEVQSFASQIDELNVSCVKPKPGNNEGGGELPDPTTPDSKPATTLFNHWKATKHPAVYGGLKTFAVSYQSCSAATKPALTDATPDVQGIRVIGTHSDGIGSKREVNDVAALLRTHPYLANYAKPNSSCFDIKTKPLIYDYGGRPVTTSAQTSTFDMFKNAGSGTSVLGTDCSGYVYMALATAGLKLKQEGRLKAVTIHGITSRMLLNPAGNGLTCLQHATFSPSAGTMKNGDIIVKAGHVVLVDGVTADPFGVKDIPSLDQCKLANVSLDRFDFDILQSSPSKNGIGIHRVKAKHYLKEAEAMATGLLAYAVGACKARFGQTTTKSSSAIAIIRHSGTAACKDTQINMERESCVSSCSAALAQN